MFNGASVIEGWTSDDVVEAAQRNGLIINDDTGRRWLSSHWEIFTHRMRRAATAILEDMTRDTDWGEFSHHGEEDIRFNEAVYDITMVAGRLIQSGEITVEDSRELFSEVHFLATKFEATWSDDNGKDYMTEIELFAERELKRFYSAMEGTPW